jgi:sulfur carrier protein ThiS
MKIIVIVQDKRFEVLNARTVAEALTSLGFTPDSYLVLVDGRIIPPEAIIEPDAILQLIPTIAGG